MADKTKKLEKRAQREKERAEKRRQRYVYIFAAIATPVILIAAVVLWQWYGPRETPIEMIALAEGECSPAQSVASLGRGDLQEGTALPAYKDYPPLSGAHLNSPLPDGVTRETATNETLSRAVHNLEHGRVVIYYNNLSDAEVNQLETLATGQKKVVVLPWSGLKDKIVLGAWARWQRCNGVNVQAITTFINSYRDKGPELVP